MSCEIAQISSWKSPLHTQSQSHAAVNHGRRHMTCFVANTEGARRTRTCTGVLLKLCRLSLRTNGAYMIISGYITNVFDFSVGAVHLHVDTDRKKESSFASFLEFIVQWRLNWKFLLLHYETCYLVLASRFSHLLLVLCTDRRSLKFHHINLSQLTETPEKACSFLGAKLFHLSLWLQQRPLCCSEMWVTPHLTNVFFSFGFAIDFHSTFSSGISEPRITGNNAPPDALQILLKLNCTWKLLWPWVTLWFFCFYF